MSAGSKSHVRLAAFIRQDQSSIVKEWIAFARTRTPASDKMSKLALEDHIAEILKFVADDLESSQNAAERFAKSRGDGPTEGPSHHSAAELHAALRLADGFDIDQMVSEYRALRASVVKQWVAHNQSLADTDIEDLTRFNEAIDQAVTESVAHYTATINHSRNLFLGILGHDLRNPIGAASMAAKWMVRAGMADEKHAKYASEIVRTTDRATQILNDLLELARTSFGTEIPLVKAQMDIAPLCHELAEELRTISSGRAIEIHSEGDTEGCWDETRMGQVLSNLMSNALQYGEASSPVRIFIEGQDFDSLTVSVHNSGLPIPPEKLELIFKSWVRGQVVHGTVDIGAHLGLGLYIAKLIVDGHGGTIAVTSDDTHGTTFRLSLPRR